MTTIEGQADELGQITFRIETNFLTMRRTQNTAVREQCVLDIQKDIEALKHLKNKILIWAS